MTSGCSLALQFLEIVGTSRMALRMVLASVVFTLHFSVGHNISGQVTGVHGCISESLLPVTEMTAFQGVRRLKAL